MMIFNLFSNDESGATAIEYAIVGALVAIAGIIAFTALGETITGNFLSISQNYCEETGGAFALTDTGADSCTY